jgi:chemotaxis protein histidine kinase CheA
MGCQETGWEEDRKRSSSSAIDMKVLCVARSVQRHHATRASTRKSLWRQRQGGAFGLVADQVIGNHQTVIKSFPAPHA